MDGSPPVTLQDKILLHRLVRTALVPLFRTHDTDGSGDAIRDLARQVQALLKKKIGTLYYMRALEGVRRQVEMKRADRKRHDKQLKLMDPVKVCEARAGAGSWAARLAGVCVSDDAFCLALMQGAQVKINHHLKKRDQAKRKIQRMKVRQGPWAGRAARWRGPRTGADLFLWLFCVCPLFLQSKSLHARPIDPKKRKLMKAQEGGGKAERRELTL